MRKRAIWGSGAIVVMSFLATDLVLGTVPDQVGVIHGCYDTKTGGVRVIDPSSASKLMEEGALI